LAVDLVPEWGGKTISLRTEPDGYDVLAPAPFGPHIPDPTVFAAEDAYGWDEMFPSCLPEGYPAGPWGEVRVADHGDLWHRVWTVDQADAAGTAARLSVGDERLGWRFAKALHFSDPLTLVIEYQVENRGSFRLPWLYYAHIILPYHLGIELELPVGRYMQLETYGQPLPARCQGDEPALVRQEAFPERSAAFYVGDVLGKAGCLYRDREARKTLALRWTGGLTALGLWYNKGGWTDEKPLTHLGLEPATAPYPGLVEWVARGDSRPLAPGESVHWTLTAHIETTG
jgi:hypothetical protein